MANKVEGLSLRVEVCKTSEGECEKRTGVPGALASGTQEDKQAQIEESLERTKSRSDRESGSK